MNDICSIEITRNFFIKNDWKIAPQKLGTNPMEMIGISLSRSMDVALAESSICVIKGYRKQNVASN